ncbi:MAG: protein kinase [Deltaproteobacteria bacterium]|jgi:hypothetical protein|nr:protein kinase [Deltaproteobacteria bacterium]
MADSDSFDKRKQKTINDPLYIQNIEIAPQVKKTTRDKGFGSSLGFRTFHGYPIIKSLPSKGAEADIYVIEKDGQELALRLYREGMDPKPEIFVRLKQICDTLGDKVTQIMELGYDTTTGRHYELQEFFALGDLSNYVGKGKKISLNNFVPLLTTLSSAIVGLHKSNIIHRDIKPSNILVRELNPLRVALADFGISSVMLDGQSIKETQMANTPQYSAPESFSDLAGEAGDYWSLGVVLLESLIGKHPFDGLSIAMVTREITTRGFKIPPEIPEKIAFLLKGLLTRDDKKRFKYTEISRWLNGDTDIPLYYEEAVEIDQGKPLQKTPYTFNNKKFEDLAGIAREIATSKKNWELGAAHVERGYIRDWMEANDLQDEAAQLAIDLTGTPDQKIYQFILKYAPDLGHIWKGGSLSLTAIAGNLAGSAKFKTPEQDAVLSDILGKKLANLDELSKKFNKSLPESLQTILSFQENITTQKLSNALLAISNPFGYIFGRKNPETTKDLIYFALRVDGELLSVDYFKRNVPVKSIIPPDIISDLSSPATYANGINKLHRLIASPALKSRGVFYRYTLTSLGDRLAVREGSIATDYQIELYNFTKNRELYEDSKDLDRLKKYEWEELNASFYGVGKFAWPILLLITSFLRWCIKPKTIVLLLIGIAWLGFTCAFYQYLKIFENPGFTIFNSSLLSSLLKKIFAIKIFPIYEFYIKAILNWTSVGFPIIFWLVSTLKRQPSDFSGCSTFTTGIILCVLINVGVEYSNEIVIFLGNPINRIHFMRHLGISLMLMLIVILFTRRLSRKKLLDF